MRIFYMFHSGLLKYNMYTYMFPGLAISNAKIEIYFSNKIYGSNVVKQHLETVTVWNYHHSDCSLKNKFIVLFIIIFCTLLFPIV